MIADHASDKCLILLLLPLLLLADHGNGSYRLRVSVYTIGVFWLNKEITDGTWYEDYKQQRATFY